MTRNDRLKPVLTTGPVNIDRLFANLDYIIISLVSSLLFIKGVRKPENPVKNQLTIRMQNLAYPHVNRARLEPQF